MSAMTVSDLWAGLLNAIPPTGLILAVGYLMRDAIVRFFSKRIEHRFETKMESFKSSVRDNEKELEQIRSFIVSARIDRNVAIQSKKFEAAEIAMRCVHCISNLSIAVEYIQILNLDEIMKLGRDVKTINFIEGLSIPMNIDQNMKSIRSIDMTLPRLYLSDRTLKIFNAYSTIVTTAAMMMKILAIPLEDKDKLIKKDGLSKIVIELVPTSKEGFDKYGDSFAYVWHDYFRAEILKALRNEVSGADQLNQDTESAERVASDSRQAQANVLTSLQKEGLPASLIKPHMVRK